jgi:cell division protein FtsW
MSAMAPQARRSRLVGSRRRGERSAAFDLPLMVAAMGLLSLGFVMVASASMTIGDTCCQDPFFFVFRHAIALGLALSAGLLGFIIPINWWERMGPWLFLAGLGMLILVLIPGLGHNVNGATRWISLGPLNLQPSEFIKLLAVIYIAGYLVRHADDVTSKLSGFIRPMILVGIAAVLMLKQPDFGTTAVMMATVMGLLFLGGVSVMPFAVLFGTVLLGLAVLVITSPYRMRRVLSFLNPFEDPFNTGYQLSQALIGFGRGEWMGVGLGNGIQKQYFLPEAHTDFIATVIAEELGLLGMLAIICTFGFIAWRAFDIGARAQAVGNRFAAYCAQGIGLWLGLQAFINIGVNAGMLPTKGLTLPFLSYGSNSLIVVCMAIAILLRIDVTLRQAEAEFRNTRGLRWARA